MSRRRLRIELLEDRRLLNSASPIGAVGEGKLAEVAADSGVAFSSPSKISAGFYPTAVAAADFNGDGKRDLAVVNNASTTGSVLFGDGSGVFPSSVSFQTGGYVSVALAAQDFNADGFDDLAVANQNNGTLAILLGSQSGDLVGPATFSTGGQTPSAVAVADFNADGKLDLVVANYQSDTVGVFLGDGSGGFSGVHLVNSGGRSPAGVAVGDFNGDGETDLAVANMGYYGSGPVGVAVLLGDGSGDFSLLGRLDSGGMNPRSVAAGDFNGDGRSDLAVTNAGSDTIAVLLNQGAGTFAPAQTFFAGGTSPVPLVLADFNGDRIGDLATASWDGATVSVFAGDGLGAFSTPSTFSSGGVNNESLAAADFNSDGLPDLAVNLTRDNSVAVLLNTSTPVAAVNAPPVAMEQTVGVPSKSSKAIVLAGDDGDPEIFQILTFGIVSNPAHGTIAGFDPATGTLTYTPDAGYWGPDSFTFTVTDDDAAGEPADLTSAPATVSIDVFSHLVVQLPGGKGSNNVVVSVSNDYRLRVVHNGRRVLFDEPLGSFQALTIQGAANKKDTVTVDFSGGGFTIPGGILLDGGPGKRTDALVLRGHARTDSFLVGDGFAVIDSLRVATNDVEQLTLDGAAGDDTFQVPTVYARTTIVDSSGTDVLDFSKAAVGVKIDLDKNAGQGQMVFAPVTGTLALKGTFENVIGTAEADVIRGNSSANRIDGLGGDDILYGRSGNDALYGGPGDDWLDGGAGNDRLYGESGNNLLLGGSGSDLLDTNSGVDAGSQGRNLLIGGNGLDTLQGGPGEEILVGGTTKYDHRGAALAAVMRQWRSVDAFDDRCGRLASGFRDATAGFIQLKRNTRSFAKGTVLDDGVRDLLYGSSGYDWFFDFVRDQTDRGFDDR